MQGDTHAWEEDVRLYHSALGISLRIALCTAHCSVSLFDNVVAGYRFSYLMAREKISAET